jgi:dUTPase
MGLPRRRGAPIVNAAGPIATDDRGARDVCMINHGSTPFRIEPRARSAKPTARRAVGLGSTG